MYKLEITVVVTDIKLQLLIYYRYDNYIQLQSLPPLSVRGLMYAVARANVVDDTSLRRCLGCPGCLCRCCQAVGAVHVTIAAAPRGIFGAPSYM